MYSTPRFNILRFWLIVMSMGFIIAMTYFLVMGTFADGLDARFADRLWCGTMVLSGAQLPGQYDHEIGVGLLYLTLGIPLFIIAASIEMFLSRSESEHGPYDHLPVRETHRLPTPARSGTPAPL